jgi:ligand-binding sensor domain-containing protein/signal transduction histidine kinase
MPNISQAFGLMWLALCLLAGTGNAAPITPPATPSVIIKSWDTEHGLPRNSVTCITQGRDGYLWLGTPNGLVRFDGAGFVVFDENNTPGMTSSHIVSVFEDSQRNLWTGTETGGVIKFRDGHVMTTGIGQGSRESRLVSACEDVNGAIWLLTANGQLWRYEAGRTNSFTIEDGRPSDYRTLIAGDAGILWVASDWRVAAIDTTAPVTGDKLVLTPGPAVGGTINLLLPSQQQGFWCLADGRIQKWQEDLSVAQRNRSQPEILGGWYPWIGGISRGVSAACEDRDGNLLVGTLGAGLFWFNDKGEVTRITTDHGLAGNYIFSLYADSQGNIWVGTDGGGLSRVNRPVFNLLEQTRDLVVQSVSEDAQGGLWVGFNGPTPASYYKDGAWTQHSLPVRTVFVDRSQRVWGGTSGGLFRFELGRFSPVTGVDGLNRFVFAIHEDARGRLWVGLKGGLACLEDRSWKLFTTLDGLSSDVIRAIAEDSKGNLWFGTEDGGLNLYRRGEFTVFRKHEKGLPSDKITSLLVDGDDVLWIGTDGGGLARYSDGKWARYTRREGLASNSIGYLLEDGHDHLWLGSNAGLMRVAKKALNDASSGSTNFVACRIYGKHDGLPNHECTSGSQPAAVRALDGQLWFPTIKGLVSVKPSELIPNPHPPPVAIELVLVDGQTFGGTQRSDKPMSIPPGKEQLEFHYSGLNLAAPGRVRFRYRMEGHESAWVEAGDSRVARYSKLPPGNYRFLVTASNEDGVWNEAGSALSLTVLPPFWRTWWFFTSTAVLLLGSISAGIYFVSTQRLQRQVRKLKQEESLEKERARIARDIHDQLGASLTQMALLGELVEADKDAPVEVEAHAQQICQAARDTTRVLDEIVWAVNPSNDTLEGLMTYVCKYAQEYLAVAGLKYRVDVPAELPHVILPPDVRHNVFLAGKEAVTNIVRHSSASAAWLRLRLQPMKFTIEIEDDGRGMPDLDETAARARNGLSNMRKRMEEIAGEFELCPASGGGTMVRLTAPLGDLPVRDSN